MKVLVTGHGGFALGMAAASRMIVGDQELIDWLPFEEGTNLSDYQAQITASVETYGEEGLLILTDFKGGTPFNVSMLLSQGHPQVAVLAGTNLAMILEAKVFLREFCRRGTRLPYHARPLASKFIS